MRLHELAENFGNDHAQTVWDAGAAAIDQIENIVLEEQLDYEFQRLNPLNGVEAAKRLN